MSRKPREVFVADFETTTTADDCRVWAWGADTIYKTRFEHGVTIETFIEWLGASSKVVYFHNLKFDSMFMIDHLFREGFRHSVERRPGPGEFTTLISDMGRMYHMIICFANGVSVEFRDSAKKFPGFSVASIASSFNLPEPKGEIDYHEYRAIGHELTPEELDYLRKDVHIVCDALRETLAEGMDKLTIGSDSLNEFKGIIGAREFKVLFPVFGQALDAEIRRAYRGGYTYADPRYTGRVVRGGVVLDVNSLYPHIMRSRLLPYGDPVFQPGLPELTEDRPLSIFSVTFTAALKPNHLPVIQIKNSGGFSATEYLSVIREPTELMVTNVDWELYQEHYDIKVQHYGGGWLFKAAEGIFNDFVDKWSAIKEASVGGRRELSKLTLNNLYGKFASNPNVTSKVPTFVDGVVKLVRGAEELRAPVYTPMGVFITSWARDLTIRAGQRSFDVFAYADTDSLHLLCDEIPEYLDVHPTRLGAWKHEYDFVEAFYVRAKAYFELKTYGVPPYANTYENHVAGLPTEIAKGMTLDDVYDGNVLHGKLTPKHVPGGIVLVDTPYRLKV